MLNAASLSAETLANVIDQSVDCVKLLDLSGDLLWMNSNGLCAMEIDDPAAVYGRRWDSLWPEDNRSMVGASLVTARTGETARFEAFCPTAKGTPRYWSVTVSGVTGPDGEFVGYLSISRDVTEAVMQRRALAIAADELRHRLKNTYAMICGMLNTFAMGNRDNEVFARDMNARLMALSTSQSFFMAPDVPRDVSDLIPALVKPFVNPACKTSFDDMQSVMVSRVAADAVALIVGELAMNSAKHGALCHGGEICVATMQEGEQLKMRWDEAAVTPVTATSRPGGQGLGLIELMVEAHRGTVATTWGPCGPTVEVTLPITA